MTLGFMPGHRRSAMRAGTLGRRIRYFGMALEDYRNRRNFCMRRPGRHRLRRDTLHTADLHEDPVDEDPVAVAEALVGRNAGPFDPLHFVDRYQEGLKQIIDAKIQGRSPPASPAPGGGGKGGGRRKKAS